MKKTGSPTATSSKKKDKWEGLLALEIISESSRTGNSFDSHIILLRRVVTAPIVGYLTVDGKQAGGEVTT